MHDNWPHTVEAHRAAAWHLESLAMMLDEQADGSAIASVCGAYRHAASMARTYAQAMRAPAERPHPE